MKQLILFLSFCITFASSTMAGEANQGSREPARADEVHLTKEQIRQIGLTVETLKPRPATETIQAPGTVSFNRYRLADVTSLVDGVVRARHARLGDRVRQGQPLLTLTSTALAQAEAGFLRAEAEHRKSRLDWKRLQGLEEKKIVSRARLQQAESIHQANHAALAAARATLASYGLSNREIRTLIDQHDYGMLVLRAPQAGAIVADDFRPGQHIAAGGLLMQIADDRTLWVEARVPSARLAQLRPGQRATVVPKGGGHRDTARVINILPRLDVATRTIGVRLEVENVSKALRPGMFVDVEIYADNGETTLLIPRKAVQRLDGRPVVFVERAPGYYQPREVRVGTAIMDRVPVLAGLKAGDRVVVEGAFSVVSELSKAGFGED